MNSCFPPLATFSSSSSSSAKDENSIRTGKKFPWSSNSNIGGISIPGKEKPSTMTRILTTNGSLQDLDLYYMKQIAHNLKEFDLEQKIDLEIKMREGTTKLLAASKHQTQSLEAAKNLLVSNERMLSYMGELQNRKRDIASRTIGGCSKARLSLSDLRIPLIWRDIDHFKNKGDYRRFAVFCLAKIGTEMYNTSLLFPIDRSSTDITFQDVLLFNKVTPDFNLRLEIYSHMLHEDLSIASASRRIKNTIHTSISRTVGKKLAAALRDELNAGKMVPSFELIATANLSLEDAHENIKTYDLKIENTENNRNQLPLFGHFCCRLAAQPLCVMQEAYSGYVNLLLEVQNGVSKDKNRWTRCWARLHGFKLKFWPDYNRYLNDKEPLCSTPVNRDTVILAKRNSSLEIEISNEYLQNTILKMDSSEDRAKWFRHLTQHVTDHLRWKRAAEIFMEIPQIESARLSYVKSTRHGSLYEQTPVVNDWANKSSNASGSSDNHGSKVATPFTERSRTSSTNVDPRSRRSSYWTFSRSHHR